MNAPAQRLASDGLPIGPLTGALTGAAATGLLIGTLGGNAVLAFAGMLLAFGGLLMLVRQDLVALAVIFLIYSDAAAVAVDSQGMPFIVAAAVPLLLAVPLAHQSLRGEPFVIDGLAVALVALLFVMGLSSMLARDTAIAVDKVETFAIQGVLMYILMINVLRSQEALRLALWTVLAAGAFLAAVTVFQYVTKTFAKPYLGFSALDIAYFTGKTDAPRAAGPVADPNYYAQLLLPPLGIGMVAVLRERGPLLRLAAAGMSVTILFALMLTGSRGGALALLAMIVVLVALRYVGAAQLLALATIGAVAVAVNPGYRERLFSTSLSGLSAPEGADVAADSAARGRFTENLAALSVFADHPVLGVGPGGFPGYYQEYAVKVGGEIHETTKSGKDAGKAPERAAHDIVLGLAADIGLVGLVLFAGICCATIVGLLRARRRWLADLRRDHADVAAALVVALTGYLGAGLFLSLAFERYLWLLLSMAGATILLARSSGDARG